MREKFKRTKSVRANEHCRRGRGGGGGGSGGGSPEKVIFFSTSQYPRGFVLSPGAAFCATKDGVLKLKLALTPLAPLLLL